MMNKFTETLMGLITGFFVGVGVPNIEEVIIRVAISITPLAIFLFIVYIIDWIEDLMSEGLVGITAYSIGFFIGTFVKIPSLYEASTSLFAFAIIFVFILEVVVSIIKDFVSE